MFLEKVGEVYKLDVVVFASFPYPVNKLSGQHGALPGALGQFARCHEVNLRLGGSVILRSQLRRSRSFVDDQHRTRHTGII
ncbi:MAG: hypothetical protein ACRDQ5_08410 [Sciscionella sp.]